MLPLPGLRVRYVQTYVPATAVSGSSVARTVASRVWQKRISQVVARRFLGLCSLETCAMPFESLSNTHKNVAFSVLRKAIAAELNGKMSSQPPKMRMAVRRRIK